VATEVIALYLIHGLSVDEIADVIGASQPKIRALLNLGGIRIRRTKNSAEHPAREPICAAVHSKGFASFHEFIQTHGLESFGLQSALLGVTEKSFVRIYESYRRSLGQLEAEGHGVPSPQGRPTGR
jgi:hypothetical protein